MPVSKGLEGLRWSFVTEGQLDDPYVYPYYFVIVWLNYLTEKSPVHGMISNPCRVFQYHDDASFNARLQEVTVSLLLDYRNFDRKD